MVEACTWTKKFGYSAKYSCAMHSSSPIIILSRVNNIGVLLTFDIKCYTKIVNKCKYKQKCVIFHYQYQQ